VDVFKVGDEIRVVAEPPVRDVESFRLEDPARLVVDLPGAVGALSHDPPRPATGPVERVRVGQHPDKLRVVLDLRGPIESHRVEATPEGVRISLESTTQPDRDEQAALAPVALPPVGAGPPPAQTGGASSAQPQPSQAQGEPTQPVTLAQAPDPSQAQVGAAPAPRTRELRLTLPETLVMALENNLRVSFERELPRAATARVGQAFGAFDPLGFSEYAFAHDQQPIASNVQNLFAGSVDPNQGDIVPELVTSIESDEWTFNAGLTGILPFGLTYSSIYNFQRLDTTSSFNNLNPQNTPTWRSELTLPLLRDLINNEANVTVKRSRIAESISREDFQASLTDELLAVEEAYWRLAATRAEERVAGKSLQTAQDLLEQTRVQYEVGVVSKVRVTEAVAGVAEREVTVILAANDAGNAQDDLLNRIAAPRAEELAAISVLTEEPSYVEYEVDDRVAIQKAMELRPELESARRRVEDGELLLRFAENQRLPRLDLNASLSFTGLSGTRTNKAADPNGVPIKPFNNGWTRAHNDFFSASGNRGWGIGARVEIPLGNRTARYQVTEREIELRRLRTELRSLEQQILLEVRRAARELRSSIEALEASERRRIAATETLRAEQERLRLGDSTPFNVLQREEDVFEAESAEVGALRAYRERVVRLERAQGTLLETRGISVEAELDR
jgi:outer membrane protein TolC